MEKKVVSLDWYDEARKRDHRDNALINKGGTKTPPTSKTSKKKQWEDQGPSRTRRDMAKALREIKRAEWERNHPAQPKKSPYQLGKSPGSYA